ECHIHARRVREVNVQPTIAVVVEQDDSAAHRLQNVFLLRGCGMAKMNTDVSVTSSKMGMLRCAQTNFFAVAGGDAAARCPSWAGAYSASDEHRRKTRRLRSEIRPRAVRESSPDS